MTNQITAQTTAKPSIILEHVSKRFLRRNSHSFKEAFIGWMKKKKVRADTFTALDDLSFQVGEGEAVFLPILCRVLLLALE